MKHLIYLSSNTEEAYAEVSTNLSAPALLKIFFSTAFQNLFCFSVVRTVRLSSVAVKYLFTLWASPVSIC